jgi:hypothetical protein
MASKLLIRAFDVEVGDCFYVRIPKARIIDGGEDDFHMLIDCGTKGKGILTTAAIKNLAEALPASATPGKKRLDLLVVSHEHEDHIKGFDPDDFKDILIDHIWLSAVMNPDHPQAKITAALHSFASKAMREVESLSLALSPELEDLVSLFSINNEGAVEALRTGLPEANGKQATYVEAGMTSTSLNIPIKNAMLRILGPEKDIDHFYLGEAKEQLNGLTSGIASFTAAAQSDVQPGNISSYEFHKLRSRMMSNAFAFAELASKVKNNASTVLLLEWGGRRLLFVGDSEWEHKFKAGNQNGCWNVMWHERNADLAQPLDFLKVGHHGSTNATPWAEGGSSNSEPAQILDAILPLPAAGAEPTAMAVVSTKRKNYKTIPNAELLVEIGKRVSNTQSYKQALTAAGHDPTTLRHYADLEEQWIDKPQPYRTDLECLISGKPWVDVEIDASN